MSYQGSSSGRGSNLQHNTTRGKPQTTVLMYGTVNSNSVCTYEQTGVIKPTLSGAARADNKCGTVERAGVGEKVIQNET